MIQDVLSHGDKRSWMSVLSFQSLLSRLEFLVLVLQDVCPCLWHGAGVLLIPYWEHWWAWGSCSQVMGWGPGSRNTCGTGDHFQQIRARRAQNLGRGACKAALTLGFANDFPCGSSHVSQGMVASK